MKIYVLVCVYDVMFVSLSLESMMEYVEREDGYGFGCRIEVWENEVQLEVISLERV
jgi:hypothetical protein